ncbi:MAG: hypothetical protein H0T60_06820 [Acidobacteria bacterium]|nr:hypothetical protein [Acidobacteriota bacterium]
MGSYSFITKPFRYAVNADLTIRNTYALARQVELETALTNVADATTIGAVLFNILKSPRIRFEVPVIGLDVISMTMYDGGVPCATLISDRFSLQAGKLVAIPDFTMDLASGRTILRCWG